MNTRNLQKNIFFLMAVIVLSKLFGMLRGVVLANYYGTTNISDAYLVASSVPLLLFYFIGQALSTAYIPMYNKVKKKGGLVEADHFTNNITNISLVLCTIIVLILQLFPHAIVKVFAVGFDVETAELAARFIRISAFSQYLMALVNIGGGYLQIHNNFLAPASVSIPRNFAIIFSIVISYTYGTDILGWGILGAYLLEVMFIIPFIYKNGYRYKAYINFKDNNVKQTLYIIAPIMVGVGISQINSIVSKSIASTISEGAISALNYASVINNAVQEILVTGIVSILFADSAAHVANNEYDKVKKKLSRTINGMIMLLLPASVGIIIFAHPIVTFFFNRGSFDGKSVVMTMSALQLYSAGLLFMAVRNTLIKVFYAYKETRTTTLTAVISITINILLSLLFSKIYGIKGLALATSLSAFVHCITLYVLLRRKIGDFYFYNTLRVLIKSLAAGFIMIVVVLPLYLVLTRIGVSMVFSLMISVFCGIIIYSLCAVLFKTEPALEILKKIRSLRLEIR